MKLGQVEEKYADTISAVNFSNGTVRLFFAGQDIEMLLSGDASEKDVGSTRFCVALPLPGFLYALSVFQNLVEDDGFKEIVDKMIQAGLLPSNTNSSTQD